ncbi:MAG TPA: carboxymuconolactone decarboxylase family protein [Acidimicrobiia bacterium]
MARVRLIEERDQASASQMEVFDHIVSSRGRMLRPFAVMLHRPEIARATADLGAVLRYASTLSDHDRELVIVITAVERDCAFELDAHRPLAAEAGVAPETITAVADGGDVADARDAAIVAYVRALTRTGTADDTTFHGAHDIFGDEGVVELTAIVGYYTMLAMSMNAVQAC